MIVRTVFWLLAGFGLLLTLDASIWWLGLFVALGFLVVSPSNTIAPFSRALRGVGRLG